MSNENKDANERSTRIVLTEPQEKIWCAVKYLNESDYNLTEYSGVNIYLIGDFLGYVQSERFKKNSVSEEIKRYSLEKKPTKPNQNWENSTLVAQALKGLYNKGLVDYSENGGGVKHFTTSRNPIYSIRDKSAPAVSSYKISNDLKESYE